MGLTLTREEVRRIASDCCGNTQPLKASAPHRPAYPRRAAVDWLAAEYALPHKKGFLKRPHTARHCT